MCVPVLWVGKDREGHVTHIGGASPAGQPWGLTVPEAITAIDTGTWDFYTQVADRYASVVVRGSGGGRHLTTVPDDWAPNNLDSLPVDPAPVAGVLPGFPLFYPGTSAMKQTRVRSVKVLRNRRWETLFTGDKGVDAALAIGVPRGFHDGKPPTFRIDALVPFPAEIGVGDPVNLRMVSLEAPEPSRSLEEAGHGWFAIDYITTRPDGTPDPTKPGRMTEVRIHVRPTATSWSSRRYSFALMASSINGNCLRGAKAQSAQFVGFTLVEPTSPPPQPVEPRVSVPNVIGMRLDAALNLLWGVPLRVTLLGPVDVNTNLVVESQSVPAGTSVKRNSGIILTTVRITAAVGVKELRIENQSSIQAPLDIWLFDNSTGIWSQDATIAYGATGSVSFADGHLFTVLAVDAGGDPTDVDDVYSTPTRQFPGDDDGDTLPWVIT